MVESDDEAPDPEVTPDEPKRKPGLRERLVDHLVHRSVLTLVYLTATFLSSIAIIATIAVAGTNWYHTHIEWRNAVSTELTSLHAGYTAAHFQQVLGPPLVVTRSANGKFTERIFQGRGFWVQTISSDDDGTVDLYTATACNTSLQPTFALGGIGTATLNRSTFAQIDGSSMNYDYQLGVGSADPFMMEDASGGVQADYVTFVWGVASVCDPGWGWMVPLRRLAPQIYDSVPAVMGPKQLDKVRRYVVANTVGDTAPGFSMSELPDDFVVGTSYKSVLFADPNPSHYRGRSPQVDGLPCAMGHVLRQLPTGVQNCL